MTFDFPMGADIDAEMKKLEGECQISRKVHEKSVNAFQEEYERNRHRIN